MTRRELRESQRGGPGGAIVITVLVVAVLGAAAWFGKGLFLGTPASTTPSSTAVAAGTTTTEEPSVPSETSPTADPAASAIEACREAWSLQSAARTAASVVLVEWDAHLDIMNDLQAGKFDLATAKLKWPVTTKNAPAHIAAFHGADQAFTSSGKKCVAPAGASAEVATAIAGCAKSIAVEDGVLVKARSAVEPWETHLKDQSHFKAGQMTAAKAEALWQSLWQKGLKLNPPYFAAAAAGAKAACTLPA